MNGSVLVSDLHLTDRPADEYRWRLFSQLKKLYGEAITALNSLWILGDLTEFKDYHSSLLVNRIVDQLAWLRKSTSLNEVFIIKGNHDGIDPDTPYFRFLNHIPWIKFFVGPKMIEFAGKRVLVLPHSKDWQHEWGMLRFDEADFILMHATVEGSVSESGTKLQGVPVDLFSDLRARVFSGDIHVPQRVGRVEYVGAPYPIRFGDRFEGRAIAFPIGKRRDVVLENIARAKVVLTLDQKLGDFDLKKGDQVKVELQLDVGEEGDWLEKKKQIVAWCKKHEVVLAGIQLVRQGKMKPIKKVGLSKDDPVAALRRYCKVQGIDKETTRIGVELVEEK